MGQEVWNVSAGAGLFAAFSGTVLALAGTSAVTMLRDATAASLRGSKVYQKVTFAVGTAIFTSAVGAVLWIGVSTAIGSSRQAVLGAVAMAVLALSSTTFAEAVVLAFDAFLVPKKRWMLLVIEIQRVVTAVSGAYLVVIVSSARHDVAPGQPVWHAIVRFAYVMGPWALARWIEVPWRHLIKKGHPNRASRAYSRIRQWTWLPFTYIAILTTFYLVYFTVIWAVPPSDGEQLADLFGHLAVFFVLVPVGIAFGLLELCPSADTMATLFPFKLSLVKSEGLPAHANAAALSKRVPQGTHDSTHTGPRHAHSLRHHH